MRAISIRQPWAWLIVNGHKTVENRDWVTAYRDPVLIHAGKTLTKRYWAEIHEWVAIQFGIEIPPIDRLGRGGIVGEARIVDCVSHHASPWFMGPHAFVLEGARPLPFFECTGSLGFFDVRLP